MNFAINRDIAFSTKWGVLLGGFPHQFGWFFFGFGLIFFWVFAINADVSFLHYTGDTITVEGIVTDSIKTGASENEAPIFENHYTFTTKEGIEFEAFSYSTGRDIQMGKTITVEYPEGKPQYSRVMGMRRQMFGTIALFVAIFPMIGLMFIFSCIKKSLRGIKLLKYGQLTNGKLVSKVPTNTSINDQTVYKLTFHFQDAMGNDFDISEKTHLPHLLEDDIEERLLYLKSNPNCAVMLDSLPTSPSIDEKGNVKSPSSIKSLLSIVIPLATVMGHGSYIAIKFIG
jgi:hypothetical protein